MTPLHEASIRLCNRRHCWTSLSPVLLLLLASLGLGSGRAWAIGRSWTGTWDTHWPGGGARITLTQDRGAVTGTWIPGEGMIEGAVEGEALVGTWRDESGSGSFRIQMSGDGQTFFGTFRIGDWWTGQRVTAGQAPAAFQADRRSPRSVLRSFLIAANSVRNEQLDFIRPALDCLIPAPGQPRALASRAGDFAVLYFQVLDQATLRLSEVPDGNPESPVVLKLGQAGTEEFIEVTIALQPDGWRLVVPAPAELRATLARLEAARGEQPTDPLAHRQLESPRAAMRTFLQQYRRWPSGGYRDAIATLDLSSITPAMRDAEAPLLAAYLKETLDRVGYVIYQEIPDDPRHPLPYVHFRHPRGDIVIVRSAVDSVSGWRFSDRTMANIRDLYEALEDVPVASSLIPEQRVHPYFGLNQFVRRSTPGLTRLWMGLELWQWLAMVTSVLVAVLTALGLDAVLRRLVPGRVHHHQVVARHGLRIRMLIPLSVALAIGIGYLCVSSIGLPLRFFPLLHSAAFGTLVVAVAWIVYAGIGLVQDLMSYRAEHTRGFRDDLLISLVGGLIKVAVVVVALVLLARELGTPLGGVLAGLGIGGVAIAMAAKDTVANLFGSAALLADRPFRRGDLVSIAGHEGHVVDVGLRSTQIRTPSGSTVSIPNSLMASSSIENRGPRERGSGAQDQRGAPQRAAQPDAD